MSRLLDRFSRLVQFRPPGTEARVRAQAVRCVARAEVGSGISLLKLGRLRRNLGEDGVEGGVARFCLIQKDQGVHVRVEARYE